MASERRLPAKENRRSGKTGAGASIDIPFLLLVLLALILAGVLYAPLKSYFAGNDLKK